MELRQALRTSQAEPLRGPNKSVTTANMAKICTHTHTHLNWVTNIVDHAWCVLCWRPRSPMAFCPPSGDGGDECGAHGAGLLLHVSGHHQCQGQRWAQDLLCAHRDEPLSVTGQRGDMRPLPPRDSQPETNAYTGHPITYSHRCWTSNQQKK